MDLINVEADCGLNDTTDTHHTFYARFNTEEHDCRIDIINGWVEQCYF